MRCIIFIFIGISILASCSKVEITGHIDSAPEIFPDYKEVTVPANIVSLNFSYLGDGPAMLIVGDRHIRAKNGLFRFPARLWKSLMSKERIEMTVVTCTNGEWKSYRPFNIYVSQDKIDPYLVFRLIPPGYQGWKNMGIYKRNLESYSRKAIITNYISGENCMNCHSFANRDPSRMILHSRAAFSGTLLSIDRRTVKLDTKTDSTVSPFVYPYWHPSGKFIAFSVNSTKQVFLNHDPNRVEVFDTASDVIVYDVENNTVIASETTKSPEHFETFPTFSPDGKWLYFCTSKAVDNMPEDYRKVRYGLVRTPFDEEKGIPGDTLEVVYDAPADSMSVSFPRISPDGNYLAFTLHGYGNFSVWHKDADIRIMSLKDGTIIDSSRLNSDDVESYHCWSSNSRWLVFSSRRDDGLFTKPYISHIDADGNASKPFLMPQKNPIKFYRNLMFSYNIPELVSGNVKLSKGKINHSLRKSEITHVQYLGNKAVNHQ